VFENGRSRLEERPRPAPGPGEALVRVLLAGICNTDLELLRGYYGFSGVAGHEFVGLVEECPAAPQWVGRRVTADICCGCGTCARCRGGDPRHCPDRSVLGIVNRPGCFADHLTVPAVNLVEVPEDLPLETAVFCEPLAAALEPGRQLDLGGKSVLVLGDGKLGLLTALGLAQDCPGLVLAGRHAEKLALARGARTELLPAGTSPPQARERLGRFDVVIEVTGNEHGLDMAMELVRPEGVIVAKTTSRNPSRLDLARLVVDEITLLGSRCGDQRLAMERLARGLDPRPLITARLPLEEHARALALAGPPGLKVLLTF
jgi:threonine dehydrogenase-like Zn-dependent dehydrogenase